METQTPYVDIRIQPTPNPNAWKFILDRPVLLEGKAGFTAGESVSHLPLIESLMQIRGVKQVHLFQNVITLTHQFDEDPEDVQAQARSVIETRLPLHKPDFNKETQKKVSRDHLPEDLRKIEEILDRTVRPGLQGDGGDLTITKYEDNKLYVFYEGACGTCPSSTTGTLMAIEGILRDEFNPQIEVFPI